MMLRRLLIQAVTHAAQEKAQDALAAALRGEQAAAPRDASVEPASQQDEGAPPPNLSKPEIAFLFALSFESSALVQGMRYVRSIERRGYAERVGLWRNQPVAVLEAGVGAARAAHATREFITQYSPPWIVSAGFAGALVP